MNEWMSLLLLTLSLTLALSLTHTHTHIFKAREITCLLLLVRAAEVRTGTRRTRNHGQQDHVSLVTLEGRCIAHHHAVARELRVGERVEE